MTSDPSVVGYAAGVTRPRSDTRERIQDVARDLFVRKGVQRTSLQEIATALGITKPALYYHFASREDLIRSIVAPLLDEGERFVTQAEQRDDVDVRELLGEYFEFHHRHRREVLLLVTELSTLAELGLIDTILAWRDRLGRVVFGDDQTLAQATRAVIAFGGLQDCSVQFPDVPLDELREACVDGAIAALGL